MKANQWQIHHVNINSQDYEVCRIIIIQLCFKLSLLSCVIFWDLFEMSSFVIMLYGRSNYDNLPKYKSTRIGI